MSVKLTQSEFETIIPHCQGKPIYQVPTVLTMSCSMNYVTRIGLSPMFDFKSPSSSMDDGRMTFPSFSLIIFTVHYLLNHKVNPLSLSLSRSPPLKFLHA